MLLLSAQFKRSGSSSRVGVCGNGNVCLAALLHSGCQWIRMLRRNGNNVVSRDPQMVSDKHQDNQF